MRVTNIFFTIAALTFGLCSQYYSKSLDPPFPPLPRPTRLEQRINQESSCQNNTPEKYAVLISGDTEEKHRINLSSIYETLLEIGFQKENMYILDSTGERHSYYPVDDATQKESIKIVFEHLRKKIDGQDLLFVYTTDHGERTTKTISECGVEKEKTVSTLVLPGEDLDQIDFSDYLEGIDPQIGIFVFEQCYSGGFAKEIGHGKYVAIASTKARLKSISDVRDSMGYFFLSAYRDSQKSDRNGDGAVSIQEAFDYMMRNYSQAKRDHFNRRRKQQPFIQTEIDANTVFLK